MKINILGFVLIFIFLDQQCNAANCGCKQMRTCYRKMLDDLLGYDEVACIEDAAVSGVSMSVFLKAIKKYCGHIVSYTDDKMTYESNHLYEVVLHRSTSNGTDAPVILIDASQCAGSEPMALALYVIEQLTACYEYDNMLKVVKWVILPLVNPDGHEFGRFTQQSWKKNRRWLDNNVTFGVDISRNFNSHWTECEQAESEFSPDFPGPAPESENETIFIKDAIIKYKPKAYLSLKRDGHAILYPPGYTNEILTMPASVPKAASAIAAKVNQRAGSVQSFTNDTMFNGNLVPYCGNSVDYAYDRGIVLSYEMRVFPESDERIISQFQSLPRGYRDSLRTGYFNGIKELYRTVNKVPI